MYIHMSSVFISCAPWYTNFLPSPDGQPLTFTRNAHGSDKHEMFSTNPKAKTRIRIGDHMFKKQPERTTYDMFSTKHNTKTTHLKFSGTIATNINNIFITKDNAETTHLSCAGNIPKHNT